MSFRNSIIPIGNNQMGFVLIRSPIRSVLSLELTLSRPRLVNEMHCVRVGHDLGGMTWREHICGRGLFGSCDGDFARTENHSWRHGHS